MAARVAAAAGALVVLSAAVAGNGANEPAWNAESSWFPFPWCRPGEEGRSALQRPLLEELMAQAIERGDAAAVQSLLDSRVDPSAGFDGVPFLLKAATKVAAMGFAPDIMQALLRAGADARARDATGRTALHLAVEHMSPEVNSRSAVNVMDALFWGVNASTVTHEGLTPLMLAARMGNAAVIQALAPKSDLGAEDNEGRTAMMHAALSGTSASVWALYQAGASVDEAILPLARRSGREETVLLLESLVRGEVRINFQPDPGKAPPPVGWLIDDGSAFESSSARSRPRGLRYGWRCAAGPVQMASVHNVLVNSWIVPPAGCSRDDGTMDTDVWWKMEVPPGGYKLELFFQNPTQEVVRSGCAVGPGFWDFDRAPKDNVRKGINEFWTIFMVVNDEIEIKTPRATCSSLNRLIVTALSQAETDRVSQVRSLRSLISRRSRALKASVQAAAASLAEGALAEITAGIDGLVGAVDSLGDGDPAALETADEVWRSISSSAALAKATILKGRPLALCYMPTEQPPAGVEYDGCSECIVDEQALDFTPGGCRCRVSCGTGYVALDGRGNQPTEPSCATADVQAQTVADCGNLKTSFSCLVSKEAEELGFTGNAGGPCCWVKNLDSSEGICTSDPQKTKEEVGKSVMCALGWGGRFEGLPTCVPRCDPAPLKQQHSEAFNCDGCGVGGPCDCEVFCEDGTERVGGGSLGQRSCRLIDGVATFGERPICAPAQVPFCRSTDSITKHVDMSEACVMCMAGLEDQLCPGCTVRCVRNFQSSVPSRPNGQFTASCVSKVIPWQTLDSQCHERTTWEECAGQGLAKDPDLGAVRCCWQARGTDAAQGFCAKIGSLDFKQMDGDWQAPNCLAETSGEWKFEDDMQCKQVCYGGWTPNKDCTLKWRSAISDPAGGSNINMQETGCSLRERPTWQPWATKGPWCAKDAQVSSTSPCTECGVDPSDQDPALRLKSMRDELFQCKDSSNEDALLESKIALNSGISPDSEIQDYPFQGFTLLMVAVKANCVVGVNLLVQFGARVDYFTLQNKIHAAIHEAVMQENTTQALKQLLTLGASVNQVSSKGYTPLHVAVEHCNLAAVKILLKQKLIYKEASGDGGVTPLSLAQNMLKPGNPTTCASMDDVREIVLLLS